MRADISRLFPWIALPLALLLASHASGQGVEIGFEEQFALAKDRAEALGQLIPGTEEYYYYRCLHLQNVGALDEVPALLQLWIKRHGRNARVEEIENRQALLGFANDPQATFDFLRQRFGLRFDHQRQVPGAKPDLPTRLDPELISRATLTRRALAKHPGTLDGFRDAALESMVGPDLDDALLMSLLKRLERPDLPNLPALVVRNLASRESRGFGSLDIHGQLLLEQLEECARLRPDLLREEKFVTAYIRRLWGNADSAWLDDPQERLAYLERLETFVGRLAPAFNSLRAQVLYHRLDLDLRSGKPDRQRFLAYLRLPRNADWVNPEFLKRRGAGEELVNTSEAPYSTILDAIGNDEPLVRAYLSHFFLTEDSFEPYSETVREDYLARLFAETKILAGQGDMERWYSLLNDPAYYEALKERVEILFPPAQRTEFGPDNPVSLEVDLKNVNTLLVKVFQINTLSYHTEEQREVDASINLDGLVANEETTLVFDENPLRRVRRRFDFPGLSGRGVYVVEFIGNGLSSRAVIRKGALNYVARTGAAGHVVKVLDEAGNHLEDAALRLGGHEYPADERGEILVPYSTSPGRKLIVLRHGDFTSLAQFEHRAEEYRLAAGIYVDRESLLPGKTARVVVRPRLLLNDRRVSIELLRDPVLTITARDFDGVTSSTEVHDLELSADQEIVHEIQVPARLGGVDVSLRGRVRSLSTNEDVSLVAQSQTFAINGIDGLPQAFMPLLGRTTAGYVLDVLGKNGEPLPDHAVDLKLSHRDFADTVELMLETDARGRIDLGPLEGITNIHANLPPNGFAGSAWDLRPAARTYPALIQGTAGETLRVPYQGAATFIDRSVASLLEVELGTPIRDAFDRLALVDGFLELRNLAPGDYSLWLKEADRCVAVRVTAGPTSGGWALGKHRLLEVAGRAPLHIATTRVEGDDLQVRLANAAEDARVHLICTRYLPAFDPFASLAVPPRPDLQQIEVPRALSSLHAGREIGDEYRYILERRLQARFPGNMLSRPGLLLNPWALDETDTATGAQGRAGGAWGGPEGKGKKNRPVATPAGGVGVGSAGTFPNLDFLAEPSRVMVNLRPDAGGLVRVPLAELGAGHLVHVVAVDAESTVYETLALPETELKRTNRRLAAAFESTRHVLERKQIEFVDAGRTTSIEDVLATRLKTYDSLATVYRLFLTLSGSADLREFAFILDWPVLDPAKQRELYSKYACHELHFFLFRKDREFFEAVVRPYLANKAHKTFLDRWLLEEDLSSFVEPWAFSRLNVVERILLSRRLEGEAEPVARHVRDLVELEPGDPERIDRLFAAALQSGALERGEGVDARFAAEKKKAGREAEPENSAAKVDRGAEPPPTGKPTQDADEKLEKEVVAAEDAVADRRAEKSEELQDLARLGYLKRLFRAPQPTRQYVEQNYWHLPIERQDAGLIGANAFWRDYADFRGGGPFVSTHFPVAAGSFAEMMLALAVLDLPFEAADHAVQTEGNGLTLAAASPLLLVRKEIEDAAPTSERLPLLLTEGFFRLDDRFQYQESERRDRFVTDEFLAGVPYGCQVVLTNPSSAPRKLELLLQIPQGAIPVENGFLTRGVPVEVGAYGTEQIEYGFYFPAAGAYPHYPVQAGASGELIASGEPFVLNVVVEASRVDTTSWEHVSQNGTPQQVLAYLESANLLRVDLARIAWRMADRTFFAAVIALLQRRHVYHDLLWSYGIRHADPEVGRQFLENAGAFVARCGRYLDSPLLKVDPTERRAYQHMEYAPLHNGRAHRLGRKWEILNRDLARQYGALLDILAYRPRLDDTDWMSVTYYLLLQDRVAEALATFGHVDPARLPMRLQYDYMRAYLDFFSDDHALARGIAEAYRDHPVARWRAMFQDVLNQLDEAEGKPVRTSDPTDRTQTQTALAAAEPVLDLKVESRGVTISYRNVESCQVRYYEMDIEFLFSTNPFVQRGSGSFSYVRPNRSDDVVLAAGENEITIALPAELRNSNVLVEVSGAGLTRRQAYLANALDVQLFENYGQLKVTRAGSDQPLERVYVKVFARLEGGQVRFHKDGYTDLRGRFDYVSLSGEGAADAERYAILVLSEELGAVIREVAPPMR